MIEDIRRSEKGQNTAYLNIGAWYNAETGHIHLTLPHSGWFHTTVNGSERASAAIRIFIPSWRAH